ncbi:crotonobetainyl-CoA hydratase [Brevibacterium sanguinis]|uniref:enoyl-CoA hydratase n=2 Tax=Brevibacterium TaxID=1696 RepID=A0A366ICY4_9MICO|nr:MULTISPECIES: enoyl-CoA hydratase-related protein [Brevibacterium]RBP62414.1 crotonobetainyl-CoA hydratase [Brevibacterium sanguinis]RBP68803.1 crotonobetainyl-CoA hydratase [Brevibacterium celere]
MTALRVEDHGPVLVIILDRPSANAVDVPTSRELHRAICDLEADDRYRVGILTGAGDRYFCVGWDLKAAAAGEAVDADHGPGGFAGITEHFGRRKPLIAAVGGLALGGGFELALAADMIVAARHAEFGLPEVSLGLIPDSGGVLRLPRRLPRAIAVEMLLTGRRMPAPEAHSWGLVNRVADGDVLAEALELANAVATGAPLALRAISEVLAATAQLSVEEGFALMRSGELEDYRRMLGSADAEEGPRAFAEKRVPVWRGR